MANPWHWIRGIEGTGPQPVAFGAKMTKEEVEAETRKVCAGYVPGPPVKLGDTVQVKITTEGTSYLMINNDTVASNLVVSSDMNNALDWSENWASANVGVMDYASDLKKAAQEAVAAELQRQKVLNALNEQFEPIRKILSGQGQAKKEQRILDGYNADKPNEGWPAKVTYSERFGLHIHYSDGRVTSCQTFGSPLYLPDGKTTVSMGYDHSYGLSSGEKCLLIRRQGESLKALCALDLIESWGGISIESPIGWMPGTVSDPPSPASVSQVSRETEKLSRETESLPPSTQVVEKTGEAADQMRPVRVKTYMGMDVIIDPRMPPNSYRLEPQWRLARMDQVFYDRLVRMKVSD